MDNVIRRTRPSAGSNDGSYRSPNFLGVTGTLAVLEHPRRTSIDHTWEATEAIFINASQFSTDPDSHAEVHHPAPAIHVFCLQFIGILHFCCNDAANNVHSKL